jgi:hypothetical protein
VVAVVVLLVAGIVSLPVAASFLDGESTENWILPVQLAAMALIGAVVGRLLPGLAGADATARRAIILGGTTGVVMALVGVVIFFLLLSGFEVA